MRELALVIAAYLLVALFLVAIIAHGVPAVGEEFPDKTPIEAGCLISFATGECQEPANFYWNDYGRISNEYAYGTPVGQLLTGLVRWMKYAGRLERQNRKLRLEIRRAKHGRNSGT